jgi:zinc resistance-associated protein
MWKKAFVGAAALIIAGSMTVYAQQRPEAPVGIDGPGSPDGGRPSAEDMGTFADARIAALHTRHQLNAEDMAAFADARIAALHAGLKLNADQEKIWPAFEQALRDFGKMRMDGFAAARDQQPSSDPVQRLQRQADALSARGAALKGLADTLAPLYQSLDDGQKRRFKILARFMRPYQPHLGMGRGETDGRGEMRGGDNFRGSPHDFGRSEGMRD